jgi:hypothetical protein
VATNDKIDEKINPHPKGTPAFKKVAWHHTRQEIKSFWTAEALGGVTAIGVMYMMQMVPKRVMDEAANTLGDMLTPVQTTLEKGLMTVCKLEECKPDETKTVKQRARDLARIVLISLPAILVSWRVKLRTRAHLNDKWGVPADHPVGNKPKWYHWSPEEIMLTMADEGTHIASMIGVQSKAVAPYTDNVIAKMTSAFKTNLGMKETDAHEVATMVAVHEIPNIMAALTSGAVIAGRHHYGWPNGWVGKLFGKAKETGNHVEKLANQAASHTLHTAI